MPTMDAEKLRKFLRQFDCHTKPASIRVFRAGSFMEIRNTEMNILPFGMKADTQDVDAMVYATDDYAFPRGRPIPSTYRGKVNKIYTDGVHPGYALLFTVDKFYGVPVGIALPHANDVFDFKAYPNLTRHGPALQHRPVDKAANYIFQDNGEESSVFKVVQLEDYVFAVHCPFWPFEASEWITRTRRHGCPSKSVIKQVARYGCDFVGVAHKLSPEGCAEWRFSFSKAEMIIIRGWTDSQRIVYRVLRLTYKMIEQKKHGRSADTSLCSYYFKTLMLWACEERPVEFWADRVNATQQLLIEMAEWISEKCCRNYFIPANNMMDHLTDTNVSNDITALLEASVATDFFMSALRLLPLEESYERFTSYVAELPKWIYTSLVLFDHFAEFLEIIHDNPAACSNHYVPEVQSALFEQLIGIYRGLDFHANAFTCTDSTASTVLMHRAEKHLHQAAYESYRSKTTTVRISASVRDCINSTFMRYDIGISRNFLGERPTTWRMRNEAAKPMTFQNSAFQANSKWLIYRRTCEEYLKDPCASGSLDSRTPVCGSTSLAVHIDLDFWRNSGRLSNFFQHWPGRSPTVNVSWFIAKAYLANLYYTQRYYETAAGTCNEVIQVYNASDGNKRFAELSLPFVLSTDWAGVFGEELKALLGFCSVFAFVLNRSDDYSASVIVLPMLYVLYLKLRCAVHERKEENLSKALNEYDENFMKFSRWDFSVGREMLDAAYGIFARKAGAACVNMERRPCS